MEITYSNWIFMDSHKFSLDFVKFLLIFVKFDQILTNFDIFSSNLKKKPSILTYPAGRAGSGAGPGFRCRAGCDDDDDGAK